ncbi:MAG: T9SS type A sorting domain-containing protein [Bacteroidales bacterium]|nr:T9SS type A sorting domain-containing protein [Bacteroidales bacterium]
MRTRSSSLILLITVIILSFSYLNSFPQCTPMSPEECPDPENNGQVCPDTLAYGFLNQLYSQAATIRAPLTDTSGVVIHSIKLMTVDNLPPGLTWVSNTPDSIFLAGNYYCVLMDGTPSDTGTFPLKIVVEIYVIILPGWPPFPIAQVTDSTSLAIKILDNTSLPDGKTEQLISQSCYPNPFKKWTSVDFSSDVHTKARLEIYSIHGKLLDLKEMLAVPGNNTFHYNGEALSSGTYYYHLHAGQRMISGKMVKTSR